MQKVRVLPVIFLLLSVVACATFTQNTYRTLYTAGTSYDMAMTTVSTLQKANYINSTQRNEINQLADYFYVAYQSSVTAFEAYKRSSTSDNKAKVTTALLSVFSRWRDLASYVNRLRPNTLPPELEEVK